MAIITKKNMEGEKVKEVINGIEKQRFSTGAMGVLHQSPWTETKKRRPSVVLTFPSCNRLVVFLFGVETLMCWHSL
jgi:hypothetical protein